MKYKITPGFLWTPLFLYYLIGVFGSIFPDFQETSLEVLNSGIKANPSENAFIEHLEAIFWGVGFLSYALLIKKRHVISQQIRWYMLISVICFFALGEEVSWGQHFFQYEPPESISSINTQKELNIHNLHIGKILGISPDNSAYEYLGNPTQYLNPLFYLLCIFIWLLLPLSLDYFNLRKNYACFLSYPSQKISFYFQFSIFTLWYLFIDNFIFDAGELFELTIASAGAITGLSLLSGHNCNLQRVSKLHAFSAGRAIARRLLRR